MITKKLNGNCPYCAGNSFTVVKQHSPIQDMSLCGSCSGHSVVNVNTGVRYPVDDKTSADSNPVTFLPEE